MKKVSYLDVMATTTDHLAHGGVFLSTMGEKPNTMTIGWAFMGTSWGKPLFIAMVRPQRFTYAAMEKTGEFTVSIPTINPLTKELAFAGTASGADLDKFTGHGLTAAKAQIVKAPIIAECGLHLECRTVYRRDMTENDMESVILQKCYPLRDFHVMYYSEILDCYSTDE